MLTITRERMLPTTMTGSYPKPQWHSLDLDGRPVSPPKFSQTFAQSFTDAQVVLRECGHWLPIERPIEVTERLRAFL